MKYLGIDYGAKLIGFAVSDNNGMIAFPRAVVANDEKLIPFILNLINEDKVGTVVVGDTRVLSGGANPITKEADAFIENLQAMIHVPVVKIWEAWSSVEASRYAPKGEEHNDGAAAAIILQRFLDMKGDSVQ